MRAIVKLGDLTAIFTGVWRSRNPDLEASLNLTLSDVAQADYHPNRSRLAAEIAAKAIPGLQIVHVDPPEEAPDDTVY